MYSTIVAQIVRRQSLRCDSVHELGLEGTPDTALLAYAAAHGMILVTDNTPDFVRGTNDAIARGLPHPGVVFVPPHVGHHEHGRIARGIIRFMRANPNGMQPYEIGWLDVRDE